MVFPVIDYPPTPEGKGHFFWYMSNRMSYHILYNYYLMYEGLKHTTKTASHRNKIKFA